MWGPRGGLSDLDVADLSFFKLPATWMSLLEVRINGKDQWVITHSYTYIYIHIYIYTYIYIFISHL